MKSTLLFIFLNKRKSAKLNSGTELSKHIFLAVGMYKKNLLVKNLQLKSHSFPSLCLLNSVYGPLASCLQIGCVETFGVSERLEPPVDYVTSGDMKTLTSILGTSCNSVSFWKMINLPADDLRLKSVFAASGGLPSGHV